MTTARELTEIAIVDTNLAGTSIMLSAAMILITIVERMIFSLFVFINYLG